MPAERMNPSELFDENAAVMPGRPKDVSPEQYQRAKMLRDANEAQARVLVSQEGEATIDALVDALQEVGSPKPKAETSTDRNVGSILTQEGAEDDIDDLLGAFGESEGENLAPQENAYFMKVGEQTPRKTETKTEAQEAFDQEMQAEMVRLAQERMQEHRQYLASEIKEMGHGIELLPSADRELLRPYADALVQKLESHFQLKPAQAVEKATVLLGRLADAERRLGAQKEDLKEMENSQLMQKKLEVMMEDLDNRRASFAS